MENNDNQKLRTRAKKITGFAVHLFWFVLVNLALLINDYSQNSKIDWAYWVFLGWGIGIISHGFSVFGKLNLEEKIYNYLKK